MYVISIEIHDHFRRFNSEALFPFTACDYNNPLFLFQFNNSNELLYVQPLEQRFLNFFWLEIREITAPLEPLKKKNEKQQQQKRRAFFQNMTQTQNFLSVPGNFRLNFEMAIRTTPVKF